MQVVAVDPGQRGVSEGVQVMAGAPFLLQHCATKQVSLYLLMQAQHLHFCSTRSAYALALLPRRLGMSVCLGLKQLHSAMMSVAFDAHWQFCRHAVIFLARVKNHFST